MYLEIIYPLYSSYYQNSEKILESINQYAFDYFDNVNVRLLISSNEKQLIESLKKLNGANPDSDIKLSITKSENKSLTKTMNDFVCSYKSEETVFVVTKDFNFMFPENFFAHISKNAELGAFFINGTTCTKFIGACYCASFLKSDFIKSNGFDVGIDEIGFLDEFVLRYAKLNSKINVDATYCDFTNVSPAEYTASSKALLKYVNTSKYSKNALMSKVFINK